MGAREAFRIFIRFKTKQMVKEKGLAVSDKQIEDFSSGVEDDQDFYVELNEFLEQAVYDYGGKNGFWD